MERVVVTEDNRVTGGGAWKERQVAFYAHTPERSDELLEEYFLYVLTPVTFLYFCIFRGVDSTERD